MRYLVYSILPFLVALNAARAQTNAAAGNSTTNIAAQIAFQISEFETNKSLPPLQDAIHRLENPQTAVDRQQRTILWFKVLSAIDEKTDPNFGTANYAVTNRVNNIVFPPPDGPNGPAYGGQVDPSVLKNPEARAFYEAKIKTNEEHRVYNNFQFNLNKIDFEVQHGVRRFLHSSYSSTKSDNREFDSLLDQSGLSETRKKNLEDVFNQEAKIP